MSSSGWCQDSNVSPSAKKRHTETSQFYGRVTKRSWYTRTLTVESTVNAWKSPGNCLPIADKSKLSNDKLLAKWFPTQALAFEYLDTCPNSAVLFSREKENGKRSFHVTTIKEFWEFYKSQKQQSRTYYEIIPQDRPCRLYFDVEFPINENPTLDGTGALYNFIGYIIDNIKSNFGITCSRSDVIDLDSTTEKKFSRHLIFHIPGAIFKGNIECGAFVKHICQRALSIYDEFKMNDNQVDEEVSKIRTFVIKNSQGERAPICDLGVYTKNRNFRLLFSTKFGKNSHLRVSQENLFAPYGDPSTFSPQSSRMGVFFVDSLICMHLKSRQNFEGTDICLLGCDNLTRSLVQRPEVERWKNKGYGVTENGYKASAYPALDAFMVTQMGRGGAPARIRKWAMYPLMKRMIYDAGGNRWCGRIGRQHKGNHVYYVVDFDAGVFYQKCHDPECSAVGYKSEETPLPEELNPYLNSSDYFVESFSSLDASAHEGRNSSLAVGGDLSLDIALGLCADDDSLMLAAAAFDDNPPV